MTCPSVFQDPDDLYVYVCTEPAGHGGLHVDGDWAWETSAAVTCGHGQPVERACPECGRSES